MKRGAQVSGHEIVLKNNAQSVKTGLAFLTTISSLAPANHLEFVQGGAERVLSMQNGFPS